MYLGRVLSADGVPARAPSRRVSYVCLSVFRRLESCRYRAGQIGLIDERVFEGGLEGGGGGLTINT